MSTPSATDASAWGISYGELVHREFFKSLLNYCALGLIFFLFLIAIFAPLLANDKPFAVRMGGQLQFPLFGDLQPNDYVIFLVALVAYAQVWLVRRNRRRVDPSIRNQVLWRQIFFCVIVVFLVRLRSERRRVSDALLGYFLKGRSIIAQCGLGLAKPHKSANRDVAPLRLNVDSEANPVRLIGCDDRSS